MIVLSYITKNFFNELIDAPINEKKTDYLKHIIQDFEFFFIGNKDFYRKAAEAKKEILKHDKKKYNLIKHLLYKSSWINISKDFESISKLFQYLNLKQINLDFIYSSDYERDRKVGELKYLKKNTMNMVISPKRINREKDKLIRKIEQIKENSYSITYKPQESFESVKKKKGFKNWSTNINKLIFVSDKVLIYDRYILINFINIKNNKAIKNRKSEGFINTLSFLSGYFLQSFVSKNNFKCELLSVFPPETVHPLKQGDHKRMNINDNWNFIIKEIKNFLSSNPTYTRINIKDWKLWNKIHERYWRFYLGGKEIKVLKFNPGFDFIKKINYDKFKDKEYEFDNVRRLDVYKKNQKFDELLKSKDLFFQEKTA